ncbi:hypothetical protein [Prosthecobacter sp.]|uniref:hypothetical protein n=1 Tax=Prosthecobacter sp. TaxID=1965333 RepID=UPI0037840570
MTWSQRKTRWIILGSLIGLLLVGALLLFLWRPGPSIRFVGFMEAKHGKMATFRVANDTDEPYSYFGGDPSAPAFSYKIDGPSPVDIQHATWCLTGLQWHTLAPHSVMEIQVSVPRPESPFAVGVRFERGTAADLKALRVKPTFMSMLILHLQKKILPGSAHPEFTWSNTARP